MFLIPIALVIVVMYPVQFVRWVASSYIYVYVVLDGINTKVQCSMFHVRIAMNKISLGMISLILSMKWHVDIVISYWLVYLLRTYWYFFNFRTLQALFELIFNSYMSFSVC